MSDKRIPSRLKQKVMVRIVLWNNNIQNQCVALKMPDRDVPYIFGWHSSQSGVNLPQLFTCVPSCVIVQMSLLNKRLITVRTFEWSWT